MLKKSLLLVTAILICVDTAFADTDKDHRDGFWTFEKITVYDMSCDNTDDSGSELEGNFYPTKDSFVEFNKGDVYISYMYIDSEYYSIEKIEFEDFFRNKLNLTETNATIKNYFKQRFDVDVGDTLLLCQPGWGPNSREHFLIFPNKFILVRVGEYFASFVKSDTFLCLPAEVDSFGGICIRKPVTMGFGLECVYADKNMADCYNIMMEKFPNEAMLLQKTLPKTNIKYSDHDDVYIVYDYRTPEHLYIEIDFPNVYVIIRIEIIIKDEETLLRFTQS